MADEQPDAGSALHPPAPDVTGAGQFSTVTRLSLKTGLAVFLLAGLLLFLLSRFNYALIHTLTELASVTMLTAVFLIGWNTRRLVANQFFVILATGFLVSGLVDLLHTLSYKGVNILNAVDAGKAVQLWLVARLLGAMALLLAVMTLGRRELCEARTWLLGFLLGGLVLVVLVWPLEIFPACHNEGGATPFKFLCEGLLVVLLGLSAVLLQRRRNHLNPHIVALLLCAIGLAVVAELLYALHVDAHGVWNFLGHYCKLFSALLVYAALVDGTLHAPFATLFRDMGQSYEELDRELRRRVVAEQQREAAHQDVALLYQVSRALHRTLNLDELAHLMLSAATGGATGHFERATLFTVNRRTGMLQGMLGVSREMAALVLPEAGDEAWDHPNLDEQSRQAQRIAPFNQLVIKQRLPLDNEDNALARAFLERRVVLVPRTQDAAPGDRRLAGELGLGSYACAPLSGRDQMMGVLLVDNPLSGQPVSPASERFLELFASQAGSALDNAGLVKRLEMAHDNLKDIQEQLIQGEKMAVLGEMAAQVAHELRNPLVSIGGFAQRLARQELGNLKANEYAAIIAREVLRMEEMLGNILAFSKKQMVCLEECNVTTLLQELIDLEEEQFERQKVEIVSALEPVPDLVGDSRLLRQVFLNIMINARQVMGYGGVLTIRAKSGTLRGERAVVAEFEDTGGGIDPGVMRNIFNPFFSTFAKGTGLGLSISHRIVAHHQGEIEVINAEKGARFIVTIPLVQTAAMRIDNGAR